MKTEFPLLSSSFFFSSLLQSSFPLHQLFLSCTWSRQAGRQFLFATVAIFLFRKLNSLPFPIHLFFKLLKKGTFPWILLFNYNCFQIYLFVPQQFRHFNSFSLLFNSSKFFERATRQMNKLISNLSHSFSSFPSFCIIFCIILALNQFQVFLLLFILYLQDDDEYFIESIYFSFTHFPILSPGCEWI